MRRLSAVLSFEQLIRFPVRQPSPEIARVHASVLGQRDGRQHDAGSMQFRCAHLMSVLDTMASVLSTASSEPRPVGTSKARDQAGSSLELASSVGIYHRSIEAEVDVTQSSRHQLPAIARLLSSNCKRFILFQ
jgi:hypothetical protein